MTNILQNQYQKVFSDPNTQKIVSTTGTNGNYTIEDIDFTVEDIISVINLITPQSATCPGH